VPELPEVETVRAGLERHVVGRTVASAAVLNPRAVRRNQADSGGFAAAITGRTLLRAERRGKYLWFDLGDDEALLAHLGMSGQLLVGDPGRPLAAHVRARFTFRDGGPDLRFTDQRTFGHLMICSLVSTGGMAPLAPPPGLAGASPPHRPVPAPIAHIAPDPLEEAFDPRAFAARLTRRKSQVKRALLDQSLVSGIGNIYADEALWRAGVHWASPTETLRPAEVSRLLAAVREVLTEALTAGGTSFDALYVNVNGESGYFDRSLNAYGREGEPCPRCGTPIRRDAFMNRSSYSCPRCQKVPRPGTTGRVAQVSPARSGVPGQVKSVTQVRTRRITQAKSP
jgi:formamidopyrimidine-DNA glycosylase